MLLPEGLPPNAYTNLPIVLQEAANWWPNMPDLAILPAQVEQETCITLKHKKCWSRYAELKTSRERGIGIGQVTKTARFDTLQELKDQYPNQFVNWSWDKPYNIQYQARGLVLKDKYSYSLSSRWAASETDRLAFMLNQYNAGMGMLARSRTACAVMTGCRPDTWFGHVERAGGPSKAVAEGYKKSFYDISREYVNNVMLVRRKRYEFLKGSNE